MNKTTYILLAFICVIQLPLLQAQTETDTLDDVASRVESTEIIDETLEISQLDTTKQNIYYNFNGITLLKDSPIVQELDSLT
ncbi:MAG: hypothetical protein C0591_14610, partial [Marinilabiliales bacterium]